MINECSYSSVYTTRYKEDSNATNNGLLPTTCHCKGRQGGRTRIHLVNKETCLFFRFDKQFVTFIKPGANELVLGVPATSMTYTTKGCKATSAITSMDVSTLSCSRINFKYYWPNLPPTRQSEIKNTSHFQLHFSHKSNSLPNHKQAQELYDSIWWQIWHLWVTFSPNVTAWHSFTCTIYTVPSVQ